MQQEYASTPEWLKPLLASPKITDICFNKQSGVFVDQGEGMIPHLIPPQMLSDLTLKRWILAELETTGGTWDAKRPYLNFVLSSGHRAHAIFPPLSQQGVAISLRRLKGKNDGLLGMRGLERWNQSDRHYLFLRNQVRNGSSIIISGSTGSGKTTLVNDLLEEIQVNERIIALEDTPELSPNHPHFLSLVSRPNNADGYGEISLRDLLRETLRMRPDRIILGECRGGEVIELLQALNTGHEGALATLHAGSAEKTLQRIELLAGISSTLPIPMIRGLLAGGIQCIARVERAAGVRKICSIHEILGIRNGQIELKEILP